MNEYSFTIWHDRAGFPAPTGAPDSYEASQSMVTSAAKTDRRTASRAARRQQLIDATMKCIAKKGMSNMTLGDVAAAAGLSAGIVNLHFDSKDNLLNETLRFLADEYKSQFDRTLERFGPDPADQLLALMALDFRPSICDRRKIAVWFAFWGEVKSRPAYRKICDESDRYYDAVVANLCDAIITDGGYTGITAAVASDALTSMTNGLWLSLLISPQSFDRHAGLDAVRSYLRAVFPAHFKE